MIVTLTAHPSIDRTAVLASPLTRGSVVRADSVSSQPGGKGVNISRAATVAGVATIAVVPADPASPFVADLARAGVACHVEEGPITVRTNLTITEPDGTTTKINTPGSPLDAAVLDRVRATLLRLAADASWVVLAGSLPPGAPSDWYATLVRALRSTPARVAVDTSDAPLAALGTALPDAAPDLLKPNAEELADLTGLPVTEDDPAAAARAARALVARGVGAVLATLGGHGAVLATSRGSWVATAPRIAVRSTVGAGDCSLFGYLLADLDGGDEPARLASAVAWGSAAASLPGTTVPTPEQAAEHRVEVRELVPEQAAPTR